LETSTGTTALGIAQLQVDPSKAKEGNIDGPESINSTTTSSHIDNDIFLFKLNTSRLVEPGCFACSKQGEVTCSIFSCVTLNQESIIRSLEAVALSQISVQNNERYFVSRVSYIYILQ
jgi:hypothetical protein